VKKHDLQVRESAAKIVVAWGRKLVKENRHREQTKPMWALTATR